MIDCDECSKQIGNEVEPIFVGPDDETVCRECYSEIAGQPPNEMDGQIDPDDDVRDN